MLIVFISCQKDSSQDELTTEKPTLIVSDEQKTIYTGGLLQFFGSIISDTWEDLDSIKSFRNLFCDILHNQKFISSISSIDLYIHEEIDQRLEDCQKDQSFVDFLNNEEIVFNSKKIFSFSSSKSLYINLLKKHYKETSNWIKGKQKLGVVDTISDSRFA